MKISILVCNLASNCIARTYPIARVLERRYDVEVIGPVFGKREIYESYKDQFDYKAVSINTAENMWQLARYAKKGISEIIRQIEGDVIYAFKPLFTSFGVGLLGACRKKLPIVLDIEDWELELYSRSSVKERLMALGSVNDPNCNMLWNRVMETLIPRADGVTVVSDFLKQRYGGVKLPHGADHNIFDPDNYDRDRLRKKYNVEDKVVVLFAGMPRPHKGLDDLLKAIKMLKDDSIRLMFAGLRTEYFEEIERENERFIISVGNKPHSEMPELLSLADLVVLPQKNTLVAQAQVPAKIFEAMAMAKPIIATNISDLPQMLDGCGLIVEPSDAAGLSEAIKRMLNDRVFSAKCGKKAREKYIKQYSWDAMEKILTDVFSKFE